MIFRASYYCALRDMPIVQNWSTIISLALKGMSELGVKEIKSEQTKSAKKIYMLDPLIYRVKLC